MIFGNKTTLHADDGVVVVTAQQWRLGSRGLHFAAVRRLTSVLASSINVC